MIASPYTLMVREGCVITATADQGEGGTALRPPPPVSLYNFTLTAPGRLKIPPTHPVDGGGPERPPTHMGCDTVVADSGPTRPPLFCGDPQPSLVPILLPVLPLFDLVAARSTGGQHLPLSSPFHRWFRPQRSIRIFPFLILYTVKKG
jgi:hypothetical protein